MNLIMKYFYFFSVIILVYGCFSNSSKNSNIPVVIENLTFDSIADISGNIEAIHQYKDYKASRSIDNKLIHIKLDLSIDWAKCQLNGLEELTAEPYSKPTNWLILDARSMKIHSVSMMKSGNLEELSYQYQNDQLKIDLARWYKRGERFTVKIKYTACPNEIETKSGTAVTSDKGLFFINADGSDIFKPRQLWTQGETQSNSAWFPVIDAPNQRTTQELSVTVENKFKTLSNGLLVKSVANTDGTRTDYWKQEKPHAPYLFALIVGEYAVIKDKWRNIPLEYYVEPKYASSAKAIFGKTPEMIEFFSQKFGVDFPWAKYSQVPVRDYVSGAMENTTATVFGNFVQRTTRELLDFDNEAIIAHELAHHWFGDLVTCESWANTTLNEGFATYAEYLWNEYKYGKDYADYEFITPQINYLREAAGEKKKLIRYYYTHADDLFDSHSYSKGALVLHMLRNYLGDELFFESLKTYLKKYSYKSAEIHDLRLVFEEVTGEDLNWFFNQWFLGAAHPMLSISQNWNPNEGKLTMQIDQTQDKDFPIFRLPVNVAFYFKDSTMYKEIWLEDPSNNFEYILKEKPLLVDIDPQRTILCEKKIEYTFSELISLVEKSTSVVAKIEALQQLRAYKDSSKVCAIFEKAVDDNFWGVKLFALQNLNVERFAGNKTFQDKLVRLINSKTKSVVRRQAIEILSETDYPAFNEFCTNIALTDSALTVANYALFYLKSRNIDECLRVGRILYDDPAQKVNVLNLFSETGVPADSVYFLKAFEQCKGVDKWNVIQAYTSFLLRFENLPFFEHGLVYLENIAKNGSPWWSRDAGVRALIEVAAFFANKAKESKYPENIQKSSTVENYGEIKLKSTELRAKIKSIIEQEKTPELKKWYADYINW
jgi:aminopeptidase N